MANYTVMFTVKINKLDQVEVTRMEDGLKIFIEDPDEIEEFLESISHERDDIEAGCIFVAGVKTPMELRPIVELFTYSQEG